MRLSNLLLVPVLLLSYVPASLAQLPMIHCSASGSYSRDGRFQGHVSVQAPMWPIPLMANAPYSGQMDVQGSSPAPVGGPSQKVWRDSQGRIRIEESVMRGAARPGVPTLIQIQDPVEGYTYILDEVRKIAHRVKTGVVQQLNAEEEMTRALTGQGPSPQAAAVMPRPSEETLRELAARRAAANLPPPPQIAVQDLGMQVIDGVRVHGTRMISTVPAGSRGNDRPITMTRDSWYSPELNLVLSTVSNSPLAPGPQIVRVANLSRNAPDPMLFLIPVDYRVVDESKDFEITWEK